ncbi:hypothetical protein JCM8115_002193 [Rhodotorula mucilaginosa]
MMLSAWYSYHAEGADETNEYGVDGVHDALLANGEVFSYHSSADNSDEAGERIALIATETGKKATSLGPEVKDGELVFGVARIVSPISPRVFWTTRELRTSSARRVFASFNDTFVHVTDLSGRETIARVTGGMKAKAAGGADGSSRFCLPSPILFRYGLSKWNLFRLRSGNSRKE